MEVPHSSSRPAYRSLVSNNAIGGVFQPRMLFVLSLSFRTLVRNLIVINNNNKMNSPELLENYFLQKAINLLFS